MVERNTARELLLERIAATDHADIGTNARIARALADSIANTSTRVLQHSSGVPRINGVHGTPARLEAGRKCPGIAKVRSPSVRALWAGDAEATVIFQNPSTMRNADSRGTWKSRGNTVFLLCAFEFSGLAEKRVNG